MSVSRKFVGLLFLFIPVCIFLSLLLLKVDPAAGVCVFAGCSLGGVCLLNQLRCPRCGVGIDPTGMEAIWRSDCWWNFMVPIKCSSCGHDLDAPEARIHRHR
jgi:hypothetical protein